MSFYFNCPFCGKKLQSDEEYVGLETTCTSCQNKFPIPPKENDDQKPRGNASTIPADALLQQQGSTQSASVQLESSDDSNWPYNLNLDAIKNRLTLSFGVYWFCIVLALLTLLPQIISLIRILANCAPSHNGSSSLHQIPVYIIATVVLSIFADVCFYVHHYYVWKLLRPQDRPAGLLATVLLLIIPIFKLYWNYKSIADQAVIIDKELDSKAKGTIVAAKGICTIAIVKFIIAALFFIFKFIDPSLLLTQFNSLYRQITTQSLNIFAIVMTISWIIMVHYNAKSLLELRRQAQNKQ